MIKVIFLITVFLFSLHFIHCTDSLLIAYQRHKLAHQEYHKTLIQSPKHEEDYDLIDLARPGNFVNLGRVKTRDWRIRPGPNSPHPDIVKKESLMERVRTGQFRSRVVAV